jgi:DNA polymerase family A
MPDASGVFSTEPKYWWRNFKAIWHVDFEYRQDANHLPVPVCMHAYERHTGTEIAMRREQLLACRRAPFDTGPDSVIMAYAANAELSCFLAGSWPLPRNVIDVYVETIAGINGNLDVWPETRRPKLPEALELHGLTPAMSVEEKDRMRDVILGHTDYTEEQWRKIQVYNRVDTTETADLEEALAPSLDLPRALFRGRYSGAAVARMEAIGLPVDTVYLDCLLENWDRIKRHYIARDDVFGLYEDTSFREGRLCDLITARGWDWPLTEHGRPELRRKTLGQQAKRYPQLKPLVRLRDLIAELKISALANTVGADGFSRCPLLPFWTRTGRNQPSGRDKIFLPALPAWTHGLIKPPPGWGCAELDWDGQEIVIMAGRSGDPAMIEDYLSGDPHLRFGKRAGLVPADATKDTPGIREFRNKILKPVTLGQNYGMTPYGIAAKTDKSLPWARNIHARHRQIYPVFHRWLGDVVAQAKFDRVIYSPFGWPQAVIGSTTNRNQMNYLAQAGGADMMRIAAIAATEAGIKVCAPVHDAFWIMAPLDQLDAAIAHMKEIMIQASVAVTGGLPAGVTVEYVVRWPQCLGDVRKETAKGQAMWNEIRGLVQGGLRDVRQA